MTSAMIAEAASGTQDSQMSRHAVQGPPPDSLEPLVELTYNAPDDDEAFAAAMSELIDAVIVPAIVAKLGAETHYTG